MFKKLKDTLKEKNLDKALLNNELERIAIDVLNANAQANSRILSLMEEFFLEPSNYSPILEPSIKNSTAIQLQSLLDDSSNNMIIIRHLSNEKGELSDVISISRLMDNKKEVYINNPMKISDFADEFNLMADVVSLFLNESFNAQYAKIIADFTKTIIACKKEKETILIQLNEILSYEKGRSFGQELSSIGITSYQDTKEYLTSLNEKNVYEYYLQFTPKNNPFDGTKEKPSKENMINNILKYICR